MAGTKEALQKLREEKYASSRSLELTSEELKAVPESDEEICLSVYGTLSGNTFQVSRIEPESEPESAPSVPEGPANRAMPSPS